MKLYYKPGACSLAPHIVASEAGVALELEKVDTAAGRTETGADFAAINPKGYVPTLRTDDGQIVTEVAVVCQVVADQKPDAGLIPPAGAFERYRTLEWLNFIATELHKGYSPMFRGSDEVKAMSWERVSARLGVVDRVLAGHDYLQGQAFTVPDAYLFTVLNWTGRIGRDLAPWPNIVAFMARMRARPAVQKAMKEEGLL